MPTKEEDGGDELRAAAEPSSKPSVRNPRTNKSRKRKRFLKRNLERKAAAAADEKDDDDESPASSAAALAYLELWDTEREQWKFQKVGHCIAHADPTTRAMCSPWPCGVCNAPSRPPRARRLGSAG